MQCKASKGRQAATLQGGNVINARQWCVKIGAGNVAQTIRREVGVVHDDVWFVNVSLLYPKIPQKSKYLYIQNSRSHPNNVRCGKVG